MTPVQSSWPVEIRTTTSGYSRFLGLSMRSCYSFSVFWWCVSSARHVGGKRISRTKSRGHFLWEFVLHLMKKKRFIAREGQHSRAYWFLCVGLESKIADIEYVTCMISYVPYAPSRPLPRICNITTPIHVKHLSQPFCLDRKERSKYCLSESKYILFTGK